MHGIRRGSSKIGPQEIPANAFQRVTFVLLAILGFFSSLYAQTPITAGYRDFYYGTTVFEAPTAEKPESKLWWNDGSWWGILWQPSAGKFRIHRFDLAAQTWVNVGPDVDERDQSLADALWDGQKLYVASHVHNSSGSQSSSNTTPANSARLYRYSYDAAADSYTLDAGFPVLVNSATSETLVLDKDSTGRLWVTWTQANKVYVNRSLGDDLTWGAPFIVPTQGSNLSSDDISTLVAFNGKIGVVWSNQSEARIYFAFHYDNKADTDWEAREIALEDPSLGAVADDHLNIKLTEDSGGNLYVTNKTSLSGSSAPGVYLLKRSFSGGWSKYVVATNSDNYTRPIVVIDDENRELYVFAKSGSKIHKKKTSLSNISFPSGAGDPFIQSSGSVDINDATSSKHNVNSATGLLILASCEVSFFYYHNYIALASSGPAPTIASFAPASGPASTAVAISGNNFNGVTHVAFNGTTASFVVNSNTQITATVPAGATTGKISLTKSGNTVFSADNFNVTSPTQYALTVNIAGAGSVNPSGGNYDAGAMVTLTATPDAGYQFSSWSGDLTGSINPATITMDANKNITATFTLIGSGGGQVVYEESKTGSSSKSTTVTTSADLTAGSGHLYLAAISTKDNIAVTGVAGLGLNWALVKAQCAGRNNTGVEVWKAQGAPSGNGAVTATLAAKASYAVIAVSRYSGVDAVNPIGSVLSGNTNGVSGACSGGSDNKSYSFNLITTANNAMVYGAAAMRDRSHTPGAGYTERAEIKKSSASVAVQDKGVAGAGTVTLNGTFSGSADWAVIGIEIKPSSSSGGTQYTLTTGVVGLGSVSPSSGSYDAGTMVTLTATPNAGYQFSNWSGDLSGSTNPATITMDGNKNITATFTAISPTQYSLNVNTIGSGSVSPSSGAYDAGTMVTLTATPNAGYQFSSWSGDLSGSTNPATITMDGNKNITATFTAISPTQYSLTVNTVGSGSVSPSSGSYDAGTMVTLTATPNAGYQFSGWSGDLSGSTNPTTITMNANKNITATFVSSGGSGQVIHAETVAGGSSSSTTVATSTSLTGVSGDLYLAVIAAKSNVAVISVSGLGLTWTRVKAQCAGRNNTGVELWMAQGTSSVSGAVMAALAAAPSNAVIAVSRYSGVDAVNPIGNIVSGNTNGVSGACSNGVDNTSYSFNLITTVNGAMVYGAVAMRSHIHTPGAGYTERAEIKQGSSSSSQASIAVQDKSVASASTVAVNGTFESTADWAMVAVEIKPQLMMGKQSMMEAEAGKNTMPPTAFDLEPNYPNPFSANGTSGNSSTSISFSLPMAGNVMLRIYDVAGQLVRTLVSGEMAPGRYSVRWNGSDHFNYLVAAGMYLYKLDVEDEDGNALFTQTRQMIFLK